MTKEEVRWLSLLKLQIGPSDRVLDIGAGTGSVAIGAALLARDGQVTAVEKKPDAVELIRINAREKGADNLKIIAGAAPEVLNGLGEFDAVFIGGSGGHMAEMIGWCQEHLSPGGRIVVNTITVENAAEAVKQLKSGLFDAFEIMQVSIAKGRSAGNLTMFEAHNPVVIMSAIRRNHER